MPKAGTLKDWQKFIEQIVYIDPGTYTNKATTERILFICYKMNRPSLIGKPWKTLKEIPGFFWQKVPGRLQGHASSQHKGGYG